MLLPKKEAQKKVAENYLANIQAMLAAKKNKIAAIKKSCLAFFGMNGLVSHIIMTS